MDLIDAKRTVGDIVTVLCEEFEVDRAVCEAETVKFMTLLVERQVLGV